MGLQDQGFAWRVGAFFGALFLVYGASLPYLPVLLDLRGLSAADIGLVSSAPLFIRLILTPAVAIQADRRGDHRLVIIVLASAATVAALSLVAARGFWPLLICVVAFQVCLQSIMPLIETIALSGVKTGRHEYGRMRLCGSVTFIAVTFLGAWLIGMFGAGIVVWLLVTATAATLLAAVALPKPDGRSTDGTKRQIDAKAAWELVCSKPILLFLLAAGAAQATHAVFYAFGVLHWRANGLAAEWIGGLWSIGVIAEIAVFWWAQRIMRWVTAVDLICIGAAAALLRWTAMAFDPAVWLLVPLQILHGLTYGASHLGAMHYIQARVSVSQAGTAQALYSTVASGVGMGLALVVAGFTYERFAGLSYLSMALLGAVSLTAGCALRRMPPVDGQTAN